MVIYEKGNRELTFYRLYNPLLSKEDRERLETMAEKEKGTGIDYNICVGIKKGDKIFWHKIGAAWKKEKGISINLNSLPMTNDIMLFPAEEKR